MRFKTCKINPGACRRIRSGFDRLFKYDTNRPEQTGFDVLTVVVVGQVAHSDSNGIAAGLQIPGDFELERRPEPATHVDAIDPDMGEMMYFAEVQDDSALMVTEFNGLLVIDVATETFQFPVTPLLQRPIHSFTDQNS